MIARPHRQGFTLLEIVLVSAVLVFIAAISYPSLKSSYGYFKLHGGIDSVRTAWAQARAHAIEEGRPYRFSVEPNGSHFRVAPDSPDYWSGSVPNDDKLGKGYVLEQALPGGVRFSANGESPPGAAESKDGIDQVYKTNYAGIDWSTTVVFLPDGTAKEDVRIHFQVQGAMPAVVHLRGLTGTVSVQSVKK